MNLFDKKFVHFMWDDSLKGKEGFIAPTIRLIIDCVENNVRTNHWQKLEKSCSMDLPFHSTTGMDCGFAYYDPNYFCKLAYAQGKTIQGCTKVLSDPWIDCIGEPRWSDACVYRVKPEEKENKCISCIYQWEPDMPCNTCRDGSNYKPRVVKLEEVKKKHRMTNRELAKWLAQGNGECLHNTIAFTVWDYLTENKDKTVSDGIKIRKWNETEWHEPELEE